MAEMEAAKRQSERVTGVSNVAYDLMVVLTNKLEGIAAMEEYKLDAESAGDPEVRALFEKVVQREREEIDEFRELLIPRLQRIQQRRGAAAAKDVLLGRPSAGAGRQPETATRETRDGRRRVAPGKVGDDRERRRAAIVGRAGVGGSGAEAASGSAGASDAPRRTDFGCHRTARGDRRAQPGVP
jgi:hypothetical protein